ncbi:alpha/beta fold hydrolase [Nocardia africana]
MTTATANGPVTTTESTVTDDGRTLRFWEAGSGEPIVLLHRGSGPLWSRTHDLLSQTNRVIMLEMPGFGASDSIEQGTTAEYAAVVHRAARKIAGKAYHLVGNSFGGLIAAWIAVQFPGDIDSVVLLAPSIFVPEGLHIVPTTEVFDVITEAEKTHPERHYPQPLADELKVKHLQVLERFLVPEDPSLLSGMASLTVPTLVAIGTEDRVIPPALGRKYPELNAAIFLSFVYDAGHALDGDRPESVASLLQTFTTYKLDFLIERRRTLLCP